MRIVKSLNYFYRCSQRSSFKSSYWSAEGRLNILRRK